MDIHLSVEISCWRQCFKRTFERYSSLDGPSSGSFGLGNSPGRSAMTLYHEPGSSSGSRTIWSRAFARASCNRRQPGTCYGVVELRLLGVCSRLGLRNRQHRLGGGIGLTGSPGEAVGIPLLSRLMPYLS